MKTNFIIFFIAASSLFSASSFSITMADKDKMQSLINESKPYVAGMGKSVDEVCQDMANDMVKKYGVKLSSLGKTPSDIRDSVSGICLDASISAESSQSIDEVIMWKNSAMKNIEHTFHGNNNDSPSRAFLSETIDHSARLAKTIAFMMEINRADKN
ncbi:TPA: hypothetical protein ACMVL8_002427 [Yersinia enterocolitica]|uniref:hypothetical protein n=1 Tax=Yersinia TaxID=629 RepID=UPI0005E16D45|nr:hypothetical protein [Yersinia rohdei]EKN3779544.1 hypothetical protein [Yersinia enterocolitica]CND00801.1 Uncharacterised protein [Yersinia frederiksenii]EKN4744834.1 hypothetical protein [Yersinia enterocolitica]EKN4878004.1 hypothetical protein [Yersinia enterocolitica]ELI8371650.1 hypothetical protein [Yersinia enterocolitica]